VLFILVLTAALVLSAGMSAGNSEAWHFVAFGFLLGLFYSSGENWISRAVEHAKAARFGR
jgi:hypothetical protein